MLNRIDIFDYSGFSVSSARDVSGAGIDDILIGAIGADQDGATNASETHVIYGGEDNLAHCDALDGAADGSIDLDWIL